MSNEQKQKNHLLREPAAPAREYWMRPGELQGEPASTHTGEFMTDPRETPPSDGEFSRRDFLKFVGISSVLAGAAACARRPVEKIVPFLNKPEEMTLGNALWYSSTVDGSGVLVKTREGRPIKLEGNPDHPVNRGGLSARLQGSIWNLYDPDRLQQPQVRSGGSLQNASLAEADVAVRKALKASKGQVRVMTTPVTGPAERSVLGNFARLVETTPVSVSCAEAGDIAQAQYHSYGQGLVPTVRLADANVVVSFGADFLGTWGNPVAQARDWQKQRQLYGKHDHHMSKLICLEPHLSLTGTNADERYMVQASHLLLAALSVAHELVVKRGAGKVSPLVQRTLAPFGVTEQAERIGIPAATLKQIASALLANRGRSVVLGGTLTGELGVALQNIVNFMNTALGNDGVTVDWQRDVPGVDHVQSAQLLQLVADMASGKVKTLIIAQGNPLFTLPTSVGFAEALSHVDHIIYIGDRLDETAEQSSIVIPVSHDLERWGDAQLERGVFSLVQPSIEPLYQSRSVAESLLVWSGVAETGEAAAQWHQALQQVWSSDVRSQVGSRAASFTAFWDESLRTGVAQSSRALRAAARSYRDDALRDAIATTQRFHKGLNPEAFQVVVTPSFALGEGGGANNSWLQELPEPVSKITWDNYASVAPSTAREHGWTEGTIIEVAVAPHGAQARLPLHIQPGVHPKVVQVARGYGRSAAGRVGNGVGVNVQSFGQSTKSGVSWAGGAAQIKHIGGHVELAVTQTHHRIEGRPILQEATLEEYHDDHHAGAGAHGHHGDMPSMWEPHAYPGNRWAMGIDLNSCTGCSACMIACQVENNVPPVGKKEVLTGREMHWIRIDRYYSGSEDNPDVTHQPMLCQHCEKAPCETVCPVLATVHDEEGLNVQVYNRCVGTRYCANNCPYKVRRFNWFDWGNKKMKDDYAWNSPLHLMLNPDVTVREKGVMEKCTFCIQRVRNTKEVAKQEDRDLVDGELQTACQQSCPTQAIRFGNVNDPKSAVSKFAHHPRGFHVLAELNVLPQVTYLTKIRNKA